MTTKSHVTDVPFMQIKVARDINLTRFIKSTYVSVHDLVLKQSNKQRSLNIGVSPSNI